MTGGPQTRERPAVVDNRCLEPAVVEPGMRREPQAVAVLSAIGERYHQRARIERLVVQRQPVPARPIAERLVRADADVGPQPPSPLLAGVEARGNRRVETEAGDVEEGSVVHLTDVDATIRPVQDYVERALGRRRDPQIPSEAIAGSGSNDAQGRVGSRERVADLVDRSVAAPRNHDGRAVRDSRRRDLVRVASALGHADVAIDGGGGKPRVEQRDACRGNLRIRACTRERVHDRDDIREATRGQDAIVTSRHAASETFMTRPAVRLMLLIVFLAAIGATSYLFWMSERDARRTQAAAWTFDEGARAAILTAHDLRAAQQAYVASGQGADFWFARTTAIQTDLKGRIAALRSLTSASAAVSAFEDALGLLQDFEQMDGRAREQVRARKMLPASDLVFADGLDLTQKISAAIEQARAAEVAASEDTLAAIGRRQGFSLVAAAAAALLIVLILLPVRAREDESVDLRAPARASLTRAAPLDEQEWSPARPASTLPEPVVAPVPVVTPVAVAPPASPAPAPPRDLPPPTRVDVPEIARLCGDLARITDTRSLPGLLERTATLIDASGIVLWIADPDGRELAPNRHVRLSAADRDAPRHDRARSGKRHRGGVSHLPAADRRCRRGVGGRARRAARHARRGASA